MPPLKLNLDRLSPHTRQRLDRAVARAQHTVATRSAERQVIRFAKLEQVYFNAQRQNWPRFEQLAAQGAALCPQFEDLLVDLYFSLYLIDPALRTREAMQPSHRLNYDLFQQAMQLPLWQEARHKTVLKGNMTKICLPFVAESLLQSLASEAQEANDAARQQAQRQQAVEQMEEILQQLAGAAGDAGAAAGGGAEGGATDAAEAASAPGDDVRGTDEHMFQSDEDSSADEAEAEALIAQLEALAEDAAQEPETDLDPDAARRIAKRAIEQGNQQIDDLSRLVTAWGSDPGELEEIPFQQAYDLYEKLRQMPGLRDFTMELGRMEEAAYSARMQPNAKEPQEIVDVTVGRGIANALPSELALLASEATRPLFYLKYAQEGLLLWSYAGREQASRGPFIVLLDVSGSTMGARERWGKAFTIAACDMAGKQGRPTGVIMFDYTVREEGVFSFPGAPKIADKVALASYWSGGGTNFVPPLEAALANIESASGGWDKADIVLVTDGECDVTDSWAQAFRARCDELGVRVHGVLLDGEDGWIEAMGKICDRAVPVQSLAAERAAAPIFNLLATW